MNRKQKVLKLSAEGFGECYEQATKHLQPMRIKQESERRYPLHKTALKNMYAVNRELKNHQAIWESGALYEQSYQLEKSKKLVYELQTELNMYEEDVKNISYPQSTRDFFELRINKIKQALADFEGEKVD